MTGSAGNAQLSPEDLRSRVSELRWFHTMDLGHGVVTPGCDETPKKLKQIRLPRRLDGMSVLDVGAFDGFFSFECERRGAKPVVAVDPECWGEPAWGADGWGTKRPFEVARAAQGSAVEDRDIALLDISPATVGTFEVVLFLGVFYHLRDPWLYLRSVASVCKQLLIIETHADMLDFPRPSMAFYPGSEVDGDPSNWWGPNGAALAGMLGCEGFTRVQVFNEARVVRASRAAYRHLRRTPYSTQRGRIVVHAWR